MLNLHNTAQHSTANRRAWAYLLVAVMAQPLPLMALPEGGQVQTGAATFNQGAQTLDVTQHSQRVSINYDAFNIANGESVRFIQPGSDAIALNRVTGFNPSQILGQLQANGQLFLINPHGILFGDTARVEVGGLLATTAAIDDSDFMNGHYRFSGAEAGSSILNRGELRAAEGGYLALVAPLVANEGSLIAPAGTAQLQSAAGMLVQLEGTVIGLLADEAAWQGLVENRGLVQADGGVVVMDALSSESLHRTVVNNEGVLSAASLQERDGVIILGASSGDVVNQGLVNVSAASGDADGGRIEIGGDRVAQLGELRADGAGQGDGGVVRVDAADELLLGEDSQATANGGERGSGGELVFYSANSAAMLRGSRIEARGGVLGGDGGFVEVSGVNHVGIGGAVDTRAPAGSNGSFLIDPTNIDIVAGSAAVNGSFTAGSWIPDGGTPSQIGAADIATLLSGGTNVIIDTSTAANPGPDPGDVGNLTVTSGAHINLDGANGRTLTLNANNNLLINANICEGGATCATVNDGVNLIFNAGGNLIMADGVTVHAGTGSINIAATAGATITGLRSNLVNDSAITIVTAGTLTDTGSAAVDIATAQGFSIIAGTGISGLEVDTFRAALTNTASGNVDITALTGLQLVTANVAGGLTINSVGTASINSFTQATSLAITATSGGSILLNTNINTNGFNGGTVQLTAADDIVIGNGFHIRDGSTGSLDVVDISLNAGDMVHVGSSSEVSSYGGNIDLQAGGLLLNNTVSLVQAGSGTVALTGNSVQLLGLVSSTSASASAIQVTSATNIVDGGGAGVDLQAVNGGVVLSAATGIAIDTNTDNLALSNSTSGNARVDNAAALNLVGLSVSNTTATVTTAAGDLSVGSSIDTDGFNGSVVTLQTAADLLIGSGVTVADAAPGSADSYVLNLIAGDAFSIGANSSVQSYGGAIDVQAAGLATVGSGASLNSGTGTLVLDAGDVQLDGQLRSDNATASAITVTSADRIDMASAHTALRADNGGAVLTAVNGIDLDTQLDTVAVTNGSGSVVIDDADDLTINGLAFGSGTVTITTAGSGDLALVNDVDLDGADPAGINVGSLTLTAGGDLLISAGTTLLDSNTGTTDAVTMNFSAGGDLSLGANADISSYGGDITLTAGADVLIGNGTDIDASGSIIFNSGSIDVSGGDVTLLGSLRTIAASVTAIAINSAGAIVDAGTAAVDVVAPLGGVLLAAVNGIDLDLDTALVAVSNTTSGNITLSDADDLQVISLTSTVGTNTLTTPGTLTLPDAGINVGAAALALDADDVRDVSGRQLTIAAGAFTLQTESSGGDVIVDTGIATLALNNRGSNAISVNESDTLSIDALGMGAGGDVSINAGGNINTGGSDIELDGAVGSSLLLNAGGNVNLTVNVQDSIGAVDNSTAITLQAGGAINLAAGTATNAGSGQIVVNAVAGDAAINQLRSSSAAANAVTVNAGGAIVGNFAGTDILAANGGVALTAGSGIGAAGVLDTDTTTLAISNGSGAVDVRDSDDVTLAALSNSNGGSTLRSANGSLVLAEGGTLAVADLHLQADNGVITLPDAGIVTSGDITLLAQDVLDSSGRTLTLSGADLRFSASAAAGDTVLNTSVNRLDAAQSSGTLTINESNALTLADLDGDGVAVSVDDGNVLLALAAGNLIIADDVLASDLSDDGVRAGLIDIQVNNADIALGSSAAVNVISTNTVDEDVADGLGSSPSNRVAIRLLQAGVADSSQSFTLGDGVGSDVAISAIGGDILIDVLGAAQLSDAQTRSIVLGSDVSINASGVAGGSNGTVTLENVDNPDGASLLAGTGHAMLLRASAPPPPEPPGPPEPPEPPEPLPERPLVDELSVILQTGFGLYGAADSDTDAVLTSRQLDNVLAGAFSRCKSGAATEKPCRDERSLRRYLDSYMVIGELPTLVGGQ